MLLGAAACKNMVQFKKAVLTSSQSRCREGIKQACFMGRYSKEVKLVAGHLSDGTFKKTFIAVLNYVLQMEKYYPDGPYWT